MLHEVAKCVIGQHDAVKAKGLEKLCIEWLSYIEKRVPWLRQRERKVESQQTYDIMHFISKELYSVAIPGTLPKSSLSDYRSYVSQKTLLDKHGLESAQPEHKNTLKMLEKKKLTLFYL